MMKKVKLEGEGAVAAIDMADDQLPGRKEARQPQPNAEPAPEKVIADEMKRLVVRDDLERDADPPPEIFLEAGRAGEGLTAADHLRKAALSPIDAQPMLAAAHRVLGDA